MLRSISDSAAPRSFGWVPSCQRRRHGSDSVHYRCLPLRRHRRRGDDAPESAAAVPKHLRVAWSELLRRTFADPLVCPRCQGRLRLVAVIKNPKAIAAILAHPYHRDDDPDHGPDPPLHLPLEPQLVLFDLH